MKDHGLVRWDLLNTLERDIVKAEMFTRDTAQDSLHLKATVERNRSEEISGRIDFLKEKTGTMSWINTERILVRNSTTGWTEEIVFKTAPFKTKQFFCTHFGLSWKSELLSEFEPNVSSFPNSPSHPGKDSEEIPWIACVATASARVLTRKFLSRQPLTWPNVIYHTVEGAEFLSDAQCSPGPLFQNEGGCSAFDMEIIFQSHANKSHFHEKGCAPNLILKVRVFGTRMWPISSSYTVVPV